MEPIRVAIIGAGVWGQVHAGIFREHPYAQPVAVCDLNADKAQAAAGRYGIPAVYTDYQKMLAECPCEAVSIVTPDFLHGNIAVACAEAGKHILIEKPLATTIADVDRIQRAVQENGVRAMVDLHNRWNPPFNTARAAVEAGEIGRPLSAYSRLTDVKWVATDMLSWSAQSSILWFLGSHSIDTLAWMFGSRVKRVYAVATRGVMDGLGVPTVDQYLTTLEFENGCVAQMENGWISPNGNPNVNDFKFSLLGENGAIHINPSSHDLIQMYTDEKVTVPDVLVQNRVFGRVKGFSYESIRDFIDRLIDGEPFRVSLQDAADVTRVVLAIMESAKARMPVDVNYG